MYHCHVRFYFIGRQKEVYNIFREMNPPEFFTYEFSQSDKPDGNLAENADIIFAEVCDENAARELRELASYKKTLIVLADKVGTALLTEFMEDINDIWTLPMSREETKFRFSRLQRLCKKHADFMQTSNFLESTINNVPILIWYKNKDGIHEKVNDSFCQTVRKTREQVEGRGHAYIWDVEKDDPACIESENKVMESRTTCVSEEIIDTGEGKKILTTYKSPLFDFDGTVMGTVGVAIDVTKEQAYKREIERKSHTLETIFTSLDCGIICHTLDGSQIIRINGAALKILGYKSKDEMIAAGFKTVAASVVDEDKGILRERIGSLSKEGDSVNVEYRVRHNDGRELHVMGNIKLIKENDELLCQRFLLDFTEQKKREISKDRLQNEMIQALGMDYSIVSYYDLNTGKGRVLRRANSDKSFSDKLSYDANMKNYADEYVHESDRESFMSALSRESLKAALENKKIFSKIYKAVTQPGGEPEYYQIKIVRTGNWESSRGVVIGLHSVDEAMRTEKEKNRLLEDALLQANNANKAKSVFLSNMSHDIRTPMNAIVGFTSLALTHMDNREQVEEYLKKIMGSGNHLLNLINDVLDMSRIESGKMQLDERPCSLPEILHGLHNIVQANARAKHIELRVDTVNIADEEIFCDKLRLNQVLLNLLSNSIKYTNDGGKVDVSVTEIKVNNNDDIACYKFVISDNGIGMSEEFVKHIFEPFERERNSTISGIQGTGLGMAITKNIVDMMEGTIEVKSEKGVGTEVSVRFMFRLNSEENKPRLIPELEGRSALVACATESACGDVAGMLEKMGLKTQWTTSGAEALDKAERENCSVFVIDEKLSDMSGREMVHRLKKENDPIIIMTAYDWTNSGNETNEGVSAYCVKPLFMSELRSCLNSIINSGEKALEARGETVKLRSGRILMAEDNELNQEIAAAILGEAGFVMDIADNGQIAVDMLKNSEPGYYQLI
ncbi:MAG: PAS domain S-box protein, partial [Oscillospiraceae bacterium]|nr:PAS domain S-box protein [Oscillospiraceae bacterium]